MRSKSKEPKHGSDNKRINDTLKNTEKKIKENLTTLKTSAEKTGALIEGKTKSFNFNKDYVLLGIGTAFFLVTAIWSVTFAVNSKMNTAVNTAYEALDSNLIYNGVFIEEVNIGCLTKEQAVARATSEYAAPRLQRKFTLSSGSYSREVTYEDLGATYDVKSTVDEAYKIGRTGTKTKKLQTAESLEGKQEYLVSSLTVDKSKMKSTLDEIAKEVEGNVIDGQMDVDILMENLENNMLIGEKDIVYDIPIK